MSEKQPPTIYDIESDSYRDVTQADLQALVSVRTAYGKLRDAVRRIHVELEHELAAVRAQAEVEAQDQRNHDLRAAIAERAKAQR